MRQSPRIRPHTGSLVAIEMRTGERAWRGLGEWPERRP